MSKLGAVAVYFFLTVLWNKVYFPGPYKALEKGIAFLYFFVSGESMESMSVDCIGLDGGYPQHIPKLLEKEDTLHIRNFCFPIRKRNGQPLDEDEATFNTIFAGFRSMVENTFGDLGSTFAKFNHKDAIRTTDKREVNMMLRLCFLLLNVRNMSNNLSLDILLHHMEWIEDGFDYSTTNKPVLQNPR
ncbi:hypothetical protein K457DRAFT_1769480 [Linnemannia elongata AG-77]|uniref:DDE Tnp4 domain-containing protein n=1 Tax=Linnemannia elongata AG-77 TaxID=1314771 RepID=A0A197KCR5_9FUNG|nr:hypothetical protein K457DRAFT_1769480 [Linnemannia elongata AG-77]